VKAERFTAPGLWIERRWDRWNGAMFIAWRPHVSMAFSDRRALLRFVAWPAKTPTGDALRAWLDQQEAATPEPEAPAPADASGFGPPALDPTDPNYETRTII
jgi:hypothetical protein